MITKSDIEKLVVVKQENSFKNHTRNLFNPKKDLYYGDSIKDSILIWKTKTSLLLKYPIFQFNFDKNNNLINLKLLKNPMHRWMEIGLVSSLAILSISTYYFFGLRASMLITILVSIITSFGVFLIDYNKSIEITKIRLDLKKILFDIEKSKNPNNSELNENKNQNIENEFGIKMTLTRLIIYPFCLFIISFLIYNMIVGNYIGRSLFGILVCSSYIIIDIKIILKSKKK